MKRDESQFDSIERYLKGALTEEEATAMQKAIAEDPDLAEEVEFQRLELDAMELILEDKLRNKMEAWKQAPLPPNGNKGGRRFLTWGVLAVCLAVLLGWIWYTQSKDQQDAASQLPEIPVKKIPRKNDQPVADVDQNNKPATKNDDQIEQIKKAIRIPKLDKESTLLALNNYTLPEDLKGGLKSPAENEISPLDQAQQAFNDKAYPKAITELNKIPISAGEEVYLNAQVLLGHSYFLNKQYPQAAKIFSILAQNQDYSTLRQDAEWYLVLSLLPDYSINQNRINVLLKSMVTPANYHSHKTQAEELQKRLSKLK